MWSSMCVCVCMHMMRDDVVEHVCVCVHMMRDDVVERQKVAHRCTTRQEGSMLMPVSR